MNSNQDLISSMILNGTLKSPHIIRAFESVDRKGFVPEEFGNYIYIDKPLPIGKDQTISQPSTVAFMLELLGPKRGDRILDIGSGSAWTTALLCYIAGKEGSVTGVERHEELIKVGKRNLVKLNMGDHCHIERAGRELGIQGEQFDKILVSASAKEVPQELFSQLKIRGVMVIPIQNSIYRFEKVSDKEVKAEEYPGFVFVPLIKEDSKA